MTLLLRISRGLLAAIYIAVLFPPFFVIALFLLPSRVLRIRLLNVFGHWCGNGVARHILGNELVVIGAEHLDAMRPAIYVQNHTSTLDLFLGIGTQPGRTCGTFKREFYYIPVFGQLLWVSGHLVIDRGKSEKARRSMNAIAELMRRETLSVWLFPEGTRSSDGRLLPFKKGFAHMALATRLPIIPIVTRGAHRAWPAHTFRFTPTRVEMEVLPPISTEDWSEETLDAHIAEVRALFLERLGPDQTPLPEAGEPEDRGPRAA